MKYAITIVLLAFSLFSFRAQAVPEVVARQVEGAFVLDGKPDEPFWATVPEHDQFHTLSGRNAEALGKTRYRIAVRGGQLLVAVTNEQPGKAVQVFHRTPFSSSICKDDSVELFLMAGEEGPLHQFAVNAEGYPFSQQIPLDRHAPKPSRQAEPAWEVAVHLGEKSWSAEFAIPLAGLPRSEGQWRMNIGRTWGKWLVFQSASPVERGFAHWEQHQLLNFEPALHLPPIAPLQVGTPRWMAGDQHLELTWENLPEGDYQLRHSLGVWKAGPLPGRETALGGLRPEHGRLSVKLPLQLPYQTAPQELIVELSRNGAPVVLLHERLNLPPLLNVSLAQPVFYEGEGEITVPVNLNVAAGTPLKAKLRLTVTPSPEGTAWSKEITLEGETSHRFTIPQSLLHPGLTYQTEIHADLGPYGEDRFEGGFYFVRGPFTP